MSARMMESAYIPKPLPGFKTPKDHAGNPGGEPQKDCVLCVNPSEVESHDSNAMKGLVHSKAPDVSPQTTPV